MTPADALFLLILGGLACASRASHRPGKATMPQAVRIRPALTPIDDLEAGDAVEDNNGFWTVCDPAGNLTRLCGKVLATLYADGLTAAGPICPGNGRPQWLLEQGLWVEVCDGQGGPDR